MPLGFELMSCFICEKTTLKTLLELKNTLYGKPPSIRTNPVAFLVSNMAAEKAVVGP